MDSVFCFEIAVDKVQLLRRVEGINPFVACSFLDYPTIIVYPDKQPNDKTSKTFNFYKGKSCLLKVSPTSLFQQLATTPIYVIALDKGVGTHPTVIGSCSLDLSSTAKNILADIQTNGLHCTSCHGSCGLSKLINSMQTVVGHVEMAYKLTSFGHSMLPHLNGGVKKDGGDVSWWPKVKQVKMIDKQLSPIENIVYPPPLFYNSGSTKPQDAPVSPQCKERVNNEEETPQQPLAAVKESLKENNLIAGDSEASPLSAAHKIAAGNQFNKSYIQMRSLDERIHGSTQTEGPSSFPDLAKYPIIQGLIEEVLQLGIGSSSSAAASHGAGLSHHPYSHNHHSKSSFHSYERIDPSKTFKAYPKDSTLDKPKVNFKESSPKEEPSPAQKRSRRNVKSAGVGARKRGGPMSFGMTKSLRLRMELNKQQKELYEKQEKEEQRRSKLLTTGKLTSMTTRKPLVQRSLNRHDYVAPEKHISYVELYKDMSRSSEIAPAPSEEPGVLYAKDLLPVPTVTGSFAFESGGIKSPQVNSRQSIEIHLPNAASMEFENSVGGGGGKNEYTSDEFDDVNGDQESLLSDKISRQLSIRYAQSLMSDRTSSSKATTDNNAGQGSAARDHRSYTTLRKSADYDVTTSADTNSLLDDDDDDAKKSLGSSSVKSMTTHSMVTSQSTSRPRSSAHNRDDDYDDDDDVNVDDDELDFFGRLNKQLCDLHPIQSMTLEDSLDKKEAEVAVKSTTDNSSTVVPPRPPPPPQLPVPPPSDSPVMRSLAASESSHKPYPPPQSSRSREKMASRHRRSFHRSTESSFHISDLSDIRSSDLIDVRTEDISDLRSSDDAVAPPTGGGEYSSLKKKMSFSTLTSLSEMS